MRRFVCLALEIGSSTRRNVRRSCRSSAIEPADRRPMADTFGDGAERLELSKQSQVQDQDQSSVKDPTLDSHLLLRALTYETRVLA